MLVNNHQLVSHNYNKNNKDIQFKGTIDKSVTNYLKTVRKDLIKTQSKSKTFGVTTLKEAKEAIGNIMTRLKAVMSQTSDDTALILKKTRKTLFGEELGELRFKDMKTGTEMSAYTIDRPNTFSSPKEKIKIANPFEVTIKPAPNNFIARMFGIRGRHESTTGIQRIDTWSKNLREKVEPLEIDRALGHQIILDKQAKAMASAQKLKNVSDTEKRKLEMKQAIKELKDIHID